MAEEIQTKGTVRNLEVVFRCKDGEVRDWAWVRQN